MQTPPRISTLVRRTAKTFAVVASALGAVATPALARAQADTTQRCALPDSIAIRGAARTTQATVRSEITLKGGEAVSSPALERAIKAVYALGQFEPGYPIVECDTRTIPGKTVLVFVVRERPILSDIRVQGVKALSERNVRDRIDLLIGRPLDPGLVAKARSRIDSLYQANGYYLALVKPESTTTPDGKIAITFRVEEGHRLAISGIDFEGNKRVKSNTIAGAMKTRPEGFFFFHKGEFDDDKYVGDLGERIPALYSRLGFVDMHVAKDTLIVDRERGKGLLKIAVDEGAQYKVGSFEISGNRRFSSDELRAFYPFDGEGPTLSARAKALIKRESNAPQGMFNQAKWDDAVEKLTVHYHNYGYLYAQIQPTVERVTGPDSQPTVNLRLDIAEKNPAIVNRIDIVGNDYTSEECIRRQIYLPPGTPFNQDNLVQSWQNIRNMGFFEPDMPFPETRPVNDQGDIDVTFKVKEKRTGQINFGASMGQGGAGFGGFIGVEQPNLFGLCKKGSLNWQYGKYFNDFTATYQDPTLRGGRISGTLTAYRSQSRIVIGNLGQNVSTGAQVRLGFPVPWSQRSTVSVSYKAEAASFLSGSIAGQCTRNCLRSNLGGEYNYDSRIELPFPTGGALRSVTVDLSGGPLGGSVNFQRVTAEARAYTTLASLGSNPVAAPKIVLGLKANSGALFGNSGPFFFQQKFAVGGVQYGQALRGYPEFSITPSGYDSTTSQYSSQPQSFGSAFLTLTGEIGLRVSSSVYIDTFVDAGNNWASARQFNPTHLYRSAGFGGSTVTPLGPLGLDIAYGFDRTKLDPLTRRVVPSPRWQFHFRLGQIF